MRVGVHIPELEAVVGGAYTFVVNVLAALGAADGAHKFVLLGRGEVGRLADDRLPVALLPAPRRALDAPLDPVAREQGLEAVWFLTPDYEPTELPFVATVWDLEHRGQPYFPEVSVSGWTWDDRELFYRSTLPRATAVVTGTRHLADRIAALYGVDRERIAVAPFPTPEFADEERAADPDRALAGLDLPPRYVLYPAQFWPHKNHVAILHALQRLAAAGVEIGAVFTGADKGNLAHVEATAAELGVASLVRQLGFVERATLVALYRRATALAFPSFFGPDNLPPLEAFALGCPVIAAEVPGAVERLGEAALRFDPRRDDELAAAIRRLLDEPDLAAELRRRGAEQARAWTAADYAGVILGVFDMLAPVRRCWSRSEPYRHL